jgi:hypothetical protein
LKNTNIGSKLIETKLKDVELAREPAAIERNINPNVPPIFRFSFA